MGLHIYHAMVIQACSCFLYLQESSVWLHFNIFSPHESNFLWFYLHVIYSSPQVVLVWNGPISARPPRGINLMIFLCDLMSQVWSWCLGFFFFFFFCLSLSARRTNLSASCCQVPGAKLSLVLQGLLRHEWLTTSPFFPSHLHGKKHWVMRGGHGCGNISIKR